MLVPNKYEDVSKNLLSIGAEIIKSLRGRRNIYMLYKKVTLARGDEYRLSFDKYLLALDFLYAMGKIELDDEDIVRK
ncbi:ABC-three component system middle component 6 [Nanoarchaeota archaeon]